MLLKIIALLRLVLITQSWLTACPDVGSKTRTLEVLSDDSFWVVGPNFPGGTYASVLKHKTNPDPYTGGVHIWETSVKQDNQAGIWMKFNKTFEVPDKILKAANIYFNVDDKAKFYLNDVFTNCFNDYHIQTGPQICNLTSFVMKGFNNLVVQAVDYTKGYFLSFRLEIIFMV